MSTKTTAEINGQTTVKVSAADQRLQHAAAPKGERPRGYALDGVHFNQRLAIASDGRIMAVRAKDSDLHHQTVRFNKTSQPSTRGRTFATYRDDGSNLATDDQKLTGERIEGRDCDFQSSIESAVAPQSVMRISLDAGLLFNLAKALCPDGQVLKITIEISGPDKAICIKANHEWRDTDDAAGIIMPLSGADDGESPSNILRRLIGQVPMADG